jgi:choline-sulfatase
MGQIKIVKIIIFLISIAVLLQFCVRKRFVYLDFVDMNQYLTTEFETQEIDFGTEDNRDAKYLLEGWGKPESNKAKKTSFRWAIGNESTILVYFTDTTEKVATLKCRPFNIPNHPHQVGSIYINGKFSQTIEFTKLEEYSFRIPSDTISYGSNRITFKWKYARSPKDFGVGKETRNLALQFFDLSFLDENGIADSYRGGKKISPRNDKREAIIPVPPGGILEYYVDLPDGPILKFIIFADGKITDESKVDVAVYNEEGENNISSFAVGDAYHKCEYKLKLTQFEKETVKIVFSNCIDNNPNSVVFWVNPVIYSNSKKVLPSYWKIEKKSIVKDSPKKIIRRGKSPHIFIYLIDTLRADHLSCYGYEKTTTPFIDVFSKDGIVFRNCFASASWTKPTVGSILTGLYPNKHRAERKDDRLSSEVLMLAEILKSMGYSTIHLTANGHITKAFNFDQGVDFYKLSETWHNSSEIINSNFFDLIDSTPDLLEKSIFAYLHTVDPHDPYTPRAPFLKLKKAIEDADKYSHWARIRKKIENHNLTEEGLDFIVSLYDCEILQNDFFFGKFIDYLKQKGIYEDSIIVLTSDHGEQFYEHGGYFHGSSIYNEEIRVPLIIKFPNNEFFGFQSDFFVSQVDILPTILEYLGVNIPQEIDGISLFHQLKNGDSERTIFVKENVEKFNFVGFIYSLDKTKQIIKYKDEFYTTVSNHEMYNLKNDFHESNNLLKNIGPFYSGSLKYKTDCFLENMERSALTKEEKVDYKKIDPETIRALKALGYIK